MKSSTHVWRIFLLLALCGLFGLVLQRVLIPKGFGDAGHYRVDSLFEIMDQTPVHQGKAICGECHEDIYEVHEKDIHYNVKCEDCHGPGNRHVLYNMGDDNGTITEEEADMPREYTLEGCLFCHRKLAARPHDFPQIDHGDHYRFLHVDDLNTPCIECHSPHEPLFLQTKVADARIHPIIHECLDCHESKPDQDYHAVADHPLIFACADCHTALVKDFETQVHASLRCTACHIFHKENESAGRIFKNGNRRFCLLCHEQKPFKNTGGQPLIVVADHLRETAEMEEGDEGYDDPGLCIDCHLEDIHDSGLFTD